MRNKKPPFEITNRMIDYVAEIAELLGKLNVTDALSQTLLCAVATESAPYMGHWRLSRTPFPWSR